MNVARWFNKSAYGLSALVGTFYLWIWLNQPRNIDADMALKMPISGEPDSRMDHLSAWDIAQLPKAERFDSPMGTELGGMVYNAQKFWQLNETRGGHHTGDDLNGIGGMNTDLGDAVYSVADGLVIYSGAPSPGWGNVLIIAHTTRNGRQLHSMYAHLDQIDVPRGDLVARGRKIGTVGSGNGNYLAHLHFEMRDSDAVDIGRGYAHTPFTRLDPALVISDLRNASADDLAPSPFSRVLKN
jgi:murein DD-endopeptidase MepM/ murein hydrolase activator NlpD